MSGFSKQIQDALRGVNLGEQARRALEETQAVRSAQLKTALQSLHTPELRKTIENVGKWARQSWDNAMPGNWAELSLEEQEAAIDFVAETGWAIVWVPRADVVRGLLHVEVGRREEVLLEHRREILEDLRTCLDDVPTVEPELRIQALSAIDAYDGHWRAAQALGAAVLTTTIEQQLRFEKMAIAKERLPRDPETTGLSRIRLALVVSTVDFASYFEPEKGPAHFSRNRTLHHANDPAQYTEVNSLASLMALVGLLREAEHWDWDVDDEEED